jgi:ribonuclease H / adenosylcobalamin/alpha-ribazole phosphatase
MDEVVARAGATICELAAEHPGSLVAAVTHGDVIRALVAHWAGMPIDSMLRLEVAPASVSAVRFTPEPRLILLNWLSDIGAML